jgi:hypothetical protein
MDLNLIDKLSIDNLSELENRDRNHRVVINHKIYDTSHEDDIARHIINNSKFKNMLLIRYEYYLSKIYHGLGRGDMVFYDKSTDELYVLELKSLRDKYSNTTDNAKIEKCIAQSIKYSEYTINWCSRTSTPVSVIELNDGNIQITERTIERKEDLIEQEHILLNQKIKQFPWTRKSDDNDTWFTHPGDQTKTEYKINGDTLESIRIVDYVPSSGSRRSFRKRVKKVCMESTKCNKYYAILKDLQGNVLMQEYHSITEVDE